MNPKEIVAKNLQYYLDRKGINQTQMAQELGYPEMTVSNWMKAKTYPRVDKIQEMADFFNIRRSDIEEDKENNPAITASQYPIYPPISAGLPIEVDGITDNDVEKTSIPDVLMGKWAGNSDIYITRTNGESMNKIIPHDSIIAVKPVELHELKDNDIVVYRNHGEYAVKRFEKHDDKLVFRPDSTDTSFTDDVIYKENADDLRIKGKVVLWIVTAD